MMGCGIHGDFEHCEVAVFVGKNPWQWHGFARSRTLLTAIKHDSARSLIVIDPRRSETAAMADFHLAVRPGTDAWCLAALAAILVQDGLLARNWLAERTTGSSTIEPALKAIPVAEYARSCGVEEALLRRVAERIARAKSVSMIEDLGVQMNRHSTLVSWLQRLVWLLTGHFARQGTNNAFVPLLGLGAFSKGEGASSARPAGARRARGSAARSRSAHHHGPRAVQRDPGGDPHGPSEALPRDADREREPRALARRHPPHARSDPRARPVHHRRCRDDRDRAAGGLRVAGDQPVREGRGHVLRSRIPAQRLPPAAAALRAAPRYADRGRDPHAPARSNGRAVGTGLPLPAWRGEVRATAFALAFAWASKRDKRIARYASVVLYRTLGTQLPPALATAASLWGVCQMYVRRQPDAARRAGFAGGPLRAGNALFQAIVDSPSGMIFAVSEVEDSWKAVRRPGHRIELHIPELLAELQALEKDVPARSPDFPYVLSAGERRSDTSKHRCATARGIARGLRNASDASIRCVGAGLRRGRLGASDLGTRQRRSAGRDHGRAAPGHVSLPNGQGIDYRRADGTVERRGVAVNELTNVRDRDPFAGTPWHKHVPVKIERLQTQRVAA